MARREIWKNDMDKEINLISNMVATCKKYILNSSEINRTVKEGLNPSRYADIVQIVGNYFASDNYNTLTQTVKTLHTDLQESQTPHSLLRDVSIQLAVAMVMFNGQRPEVANFISHDDLLSKQNHPTLSNHSVILVNE